MINKEEIKNIVEEFFNKAGFETSINIEQKEGVINIDIKTKDAQTLIGRQGLVLADIQLLLRKIINRGAEIKDILDFSTGIDEMVNRLSAEINERHKKEINLIKKSGMDEEYISRALKETEESQKREKKKFSNLIIGHVFDIISAYVEDIMITISGCGKELLNRKNNYEEICSSYCSGPKNKKLSLFSDIQARIALNRKSLTENINYEIALDRILLELVVA